MSRHKSPERIQLEHDRAIRRERREQKKKDREDRRKVRLERRRIHELIKANGVPKIKTEPERFSIQDALTFSPCPGCRRIVGNIDVVDKFCAGCEYREEVIRDEGLKLETQGDTPGADRLTATAKSLETPPSGQLSLDL